MKIRQNLCIKKWKIVLGLGLWLVSLTNDATGQGVLIDTLAIDTLPVWSPINEKGDNKPSPKQVSLKKFSPPPFDQQNTLTCVAWACAYGALTIEKQEPNDPYSASYIIKQLLKKSVGGFEVPTVLDFMRDSGVPHARNFQNLNMPLLAFKSSDAPKEILEKDTREHKIQGWQCIFKKNKDILNKENEFTDTHIRTFKSILFKGHPIVLVARTEVNFRNVKGTIWKPAVVGTDLHAMVIVGYDDADGGTFELMNSYGKAWANAGFINISYNDLKKVAEFAYVLTDSPTSKGNEGEANTAAIRPMIVKDTIQLTLKKLFENDKHERGFKAVDMHYDSTKRQYVVRPVTNGAAFKISVSTIAQNKIIYVFSVNRDSSVSQNGVFDAHSADNQPFMLPEKSVIPVGDGGEEYIMTLVADTQLADYGKRMEQFKKTSGDVNVRLKASFGDVLVEDNGQIDHMKNETGVDIRYLPVKDMPRHVVPIVWAIKIKED